MHDDLELARAVRDATLRVKGVAALGKGKMAEAATYGPNEKVLGVVIGVDAVQVNVVASYPDGLPAPQLAERVRDNIARLVSNRRINVVVEDLAEVRA